MPISWEEITLKCWEQLTGEISSHRRTYWIDLQLRCVFLLLKLSFLTFTFSAWSSSTSWRMDSPSTTPQSTRSEGCFLQFSIPRLTNHLIYWRWVIIIYPSTAPGIMTLVNSMFNFQFRFPRQVKMVGRRGGPGVRCILSLSNWSMYVIIFSWL